MPTTALNICQTALQMIGAYGAGDPLSDADAALMLRLLNSMMDNWSNLTLACYEVTEQSLVLVPGQQSYTVGPGGYANGTRPLKILTDPGTAYIQDNNGNNYPVEVVPRDKWNQYGNRSDLVNSNFPSVLFYDPQFPLGIINFTPIPNEAYTAFFDSMLQLTDFATLATAVSLPPGYEMAMYSNLAILAHPFFMDGQINPAIVKIAATSLGDVKRTNIRDNYAIFDPEIVSRAQLSYNVFTDSPGSAVRGS